MHGDKFSILLHRPCKPRWQSMARSQIFLLFRSHLSRRLIALGCGFQTKVRIITSHKVCQPIRPGGGLLSPQICTPSDLFSFSHIRNASRLEQDRLGPLRTVCASPTGMRATVEELVQRWKDEWPRVEVGSPLQHNSKRQSRSVHRPRLGIGLALCNIFAR